MSDNEVHPLISSIELKNKAIKNKADSRVIKNLEKIIAERAKTSISIMRKSKYVSNILDDIENVEEIDYDNEKA